MKQNRKVIKWKKKGKKKRKAMPGTGLLTDCDKIVLRRKRRPVPTKPHREKTKENNNNNNPHNLFSLLMEDSYVSILAMGQGGGSGAGRTCG